MRRLLPLLLAGLLALAGVAALGVGLAQRTVWLPDDQVTATAELPADVPVMVTEPGVLEMREGPVSVTVTAVPPESSEPTEPTESTESTESTEPAEPTDSTEPEAPGTPVIIAMGREDDVAAWVDGAAHARVGGLVNPDTLSVEVVEGEPEVPNPAVSSDLWVETEQGDGGATFVYDPPPGRWVLLAATDGTVPGVTQVALTWPREVSTPWSMPLIILGSALLAAAVFLGGWRWYRGSGRQQS